MPRKTGDVSFTCCGRDVQLPVFSWWKSKPEKENATDTEKDNNKGRYTEFSVSGIF